MSPNKTIAFLLLAFSSILVTLAYVFIKTIPQTVSHAIYKCQQAIATFMITFPHETPYIVLLVLLIIALIGTAALAYQLWQTQSLIRNLGKHTQKTYLKLDRVAQKLGMMGKIDIIASKSDICLCYGYIKPRIYISTTLIERLQLHELEAALLHEKYHLLNYDPLKILLSKTAAITFFFIPTFKDLQRHYALTKEIAADNLVVKAGYKNSLVAVLSKVLTSNYHSINAVAFLAHSEDLEIRILHLAGVNKRFSIGPILWNLIVSFIVISILFLAVKTPVHAMSINDQTLAHVYHACPVSSQCMSACTTNDPATTQSKNNSTNINFTPVQ